MKKQSYLSVLMALMILVFAGCSDDDKDEKEDEQPSEIAVSDYGAYLPGEWQDDYATRYLCTDGTFYNDFNNGNSNEGTWELAGDELTMNYPGETYVYTIEYMLEDEYKIVDQESGSEYTATLQDTDGCYWLDVDDYEAYMPGKWKYEKDGEEDTYWLCDDNTFHFESTEYYDDHGTWSVDGDELNVNWSKGNGEKVVSYDILKMRPDVVYMKRGSYEYEWNRVASDGCYEEPMGSLAFYLSEDCGCGPVTVSIEGDEVGELTQYIMSGDVTCGTDGALTIEISPGTYDVYAECEGLYWEFTTSVSDGGCTTEELGCSKAMAK